jgi:hypothetical protein
MFAVNAVPETTPATGRLDSVLTPDVQQCIMAQDDWVFWPELYLLGCISRSVFGSSAEVGQRINGMLRIVAAFLGRRWLHHIERLPTRCELKTSQQRFRVEAQSLFRCKTFTALTTGK